MHYLHHVRIYIDTRCEYICVDTISLQKYLWLLSMRINMCNTFVRLINTQLLLAVKVSYDTCACAFTCSRGVEGHRLVSRWNDLEIPCGCSLFSTCMQDAVSLTIMLTAAVQVRNSGVLRKTPMTSNENKYMYYTNL